MESSWHFSVMKFLPPATTGFIPVGRSLVTKRRSRFQATFEHPTNTTVRANSVG